jgi:hypothetical protein
MQIEWDEWIEIKVHVIGEFNKESGDGWNEPKILAHIEIEDIELEDDLKNKIRKENYERFQEEGWKRVEPDYNF